MEIAPRFVLITGGQKCGRYACITGETSCQFQVTSWTGSGTVCHRVWKENVKAVSDPKLIPPELAVHVKEAHNVGVKQEDFASEKEAHNVVLKQEDFALDEDKNYEMKIRLVQKEIAKLNVRLDSEKDKIYEMKIRLLQKEIAKLEIRLEDAEHKMKKLAKYTNVQLN